MNVRNLSPFVPSTSRVKSRDEVEGRGAMQGRVSTLLDTNGFVVVNAHAR